MAEIVTDQQVCPSCGVEVRPNSMFCYNCGGNVEETPEQIPVEDFNSENDADSAVETSASLETSKLIAPTETEKFTDIKVEKTSVKEENTLAKENEQVIETVATDEKSKKIAEPKLKSAANMRRQTKTSSLRQVEVVWEKPESDSLVRLILVTLLMLVFAAAVVYFGVYLK